MRLGRLRRRVPLLEVVHCVPVLFQPLKVFEDARGSVGGEAHGVERAPDQLGADELQSLLLLRRVRLRAVRSGTSLPAAPPTLLQKAVAEPTLFLLGLEPRAQRHRVDGREQRLDHRLEVRHLQGLRRGSGVPADDVAHCDVHPAPARVHHRLAGLPAPERQVRELLGQLQREGHGL